MMQRAVALLPVVRHGFPCIFSVPEKTFAEIPHILFSIYMCNVISSASPFLSLKVLEKRKEGVGN